jgi:preprotein translocase subunit SecG
MLVPAIANLLLTTVLQLTYHAHAAIEEDRVLGQREIAAFFLPMVFTSLLFTLSRPIILAFITAQKDADVVRVETMVAGVSLAWSFNVIFQGAVNQFRDVFITFGRRDLNGVRTFMAVATAVLTCIMLLVVATPLGTLFLSYLQGATGETLRIARQAMWVLVFVPPIIAWRNYYHGLTMLHRRTHGMTAGSFMRNVAILAAAWLLTALGLYNHVAAAGTLVIGFAAEAVTVALFTRAWWQQKATEAAV